MIRRRIEPKYSTPKIFVGQRVKFHRGISEREGVVIEDRGPLGREGRQVIRIRYFVDYAGDGTLEPVETETNAENVEVIDNFLAADNIVE
jgi:hypothetical protein